MNAKTLAHEWAHQVKPRGKASALSYEGPVIRSYQTAIGRILAPGVYLVNTANFSVTTTGKHQNPMRRAIPHDAVTLYYEDGNRGTNLNPSGTQVVEYNARMVERHLETAARARKTTVKALYYELAHQAAFDANAAALFYKAALPVGFDELRARVASLSAASAEERKAMEKVENAKREAAAAEKLARWLTGEIDNVPHLTHARFRVDPRASDIVESSHSARVPLADFTRALRFALARRGKEWRANGETCPVGNYQLSSISDAGVVAGCHRVTWEEIGRLAAILL
jgi:hypothetical protein